MEELIFEPVIILQEEPDSIKEQLTTLFRSYMERQTLKDTLTLFRIKEKHRSKPMTLAMDILTSIGTAGFVWELTGLNMMRLKKTRLAGFTLCSVVGIDVLSNNFLTKYLIQRERPCTRYPDEYMRRSFPVGYSFPSGHTLTSASAATILVLSDWKNVFWAVPLASGIAYSRLYLFAHYPTDVYFGALDGICAGLFGWWMTHTLYLNNYIPLFTWYINKKTLTQMSEIRFEKRFKKQTGEVLSDKAAVRKKQLRAYQKEEKEKIQHKKAIKKERHQHFVTILKKGIEIAKVLKEE